MFSVRDVLVGLMFLVVAACGSGDSAGPEPTVAGRQTTSDATVRSTVATTSGTSEVSTSTSSEPESTASTVATAPPTTVPETPSFDVAEVVDRRVRVARAVVAADDGTILATVTDTGGIGCEGTVPHYYVTISPAGDPVAVTADDGPIYAGLPQASPNRRQVLDVVACEGFLQDVSIYPVGEDLDLEAPIPVEVGDAVSGDASWTADGFVSLFLTDGMPFLEPDAEAAVAEYLVNPRTGERTQSAELDQFRWGAVRLPDGRLVYNGSDEVGALVVIEQRDGSVEASYPAADFAVSPDGQRMLIWDSVFDTETDIAIELVDLGSGAVERLAAGSAFRATWSGNGDRVAFSNGLETYVHDLPSGDTITVGSTRPEGCEDDEWVVWGRVPLVFAPGGDLYIGDAVCGVTADGFPFDEFRLHQVAFAERSDG